MNNILISVTVTYLLPGSGVSAGSSDSIAIIWIFMLRLLSFAPSFKFMLSNSVSRKSFFWANILSMGIISVVWAMATTLILTFINKMNINIIVLFTVINQSNNGKLFDFIIKFIVAAMEISGNIPNPYIASFSMLLLAVIICNFNYLLIRRAHIK